MTLSSNHLLRSKTYATSPIISWQAAHKQIQPYHHLAAMPLVVPDLASNTSGQNAQEQWFSKLAGKKISDKHDETVRFACHSVFTRLTKLNEELCKAGSSRTASRPRARLYEDDGL